MVDSIIKNQTNTLMFRFSVAFMFWRRQSELSGKSNLHNYTPDAGRQLSKVSPLGCCLCGCCSSARFPFVRRSVRSCSVCRWSISERVECCASEVRKHFSARLVVVGKIEIFPPFMLGSFSRVFCGVSGNLWIVVIRGRRSEFPGVDWFGWKGWNTVEFRGDFWSVWQRKRTSSSCRKWPWEKCEEISDSVIFGSVCWLLECLQMIPTEVKSWGKEAGFYRSSRWIPPTGSGLQHQQQFLQKWKWICSCDRLLYVWLVRATWNLAN